MEGRLARPMDPALSARLAMLHDPHTGLISADDDAVIAAAESLRHAVSDVALAQDIVRAGGVLPLLSNTLSSTNVKVLLAGLGALRAVVHANVANQEAARRIGLLDAVIALLLDQQIRDEARRGSLMTAVGVLVCSNRVSQEALHGAGGVSHLVSLAAYSGFDGLRERALYALCCATAGNVAIRDDVVLLGGVHAAVANLPRHASHDGSVQRRVLQTLAALRAWVPGGAEGTLAVLAAGGIEALLSLLRSPPAIAAEACHTLCLVLDQSLEARRAVLGAAEGLSALAELLGAGPAKAARLQDGESAALEGGTAVATALPHAQYVTDFRYTNGEKPFYGGRGGPYYNRTVVETFAGTFSFNTADVCWYMDSKFCAPFHELKRACGSPENARLLVWGLTYGLTALALLFYLGLFCNMLMRTTGCVNGMCDDDQEADKDGDGINDADDEDGDGQLSCQERANAVLRTLSHWNPFVLTIFILLLILPPLVTTRIFAPCFDCYDFEAAALHEIGHFLGLGHPDNIPDNWLIDQPAALPKPGNNSYHEYIALAMQNGSRPDVSLFCTTPWEDVRGGVPDGAFIDTDKLGARCASAAASRPCQAVASAIRRVMPPGPGLPARLTFASPPHPSAQLPDARCADGGAHAAQPDDVSDGRRPRGPRRHLPRLRRRVRALRRRLPRGQPQHWHRAPRGAS